MSDWKKKTDWRSATDPKTGRVYYYNKVTKESTWHKPLELASESERREMERKRKETIQFFKEMEENIHRIFDEDAAQKQSNEEFLELREDEMFEYIDDDDYDDRMDRMLRNSVNCHREALAGNVEDYYDSRPTSARRGSIGGIRLVRTISSIDDEVMELMKRSKSNSNLNEYEVKVGGGYDVSVDSPLYGEFRRRSGVYSPVNAGMSMTTGIAMSKNSTVNTPRLRGNSREAFPAVIPKNLETRKRRNSTGTLYIDSTLSQQDNKATMRCVCAVIRMHMVKAEKENIVPRPEFDIFKDEYYVKLENRMRSQASEASMEIALCAADRQLPSLSTIVNFFQNTFSKSQMENECIIMSLIYIERLIKVTKGRFCIRYDNWRSTSFACMIMASKVWDDLSMWNVDFSQISECFDLKRINELELAMLSALNYEVKVPAGEYAKYYFHLRSMIARLGYHQRLNSELRPLNIEGARKLQLATEEYANTKMVAAGERGLFRSRSRTVATDSTDVEDVPMPDKIGRFNSENTNGTTKHMRNRSVELEHLLHNSHIHGDGQNSVEANKRKTGVI